MQKELAGKWMAAFNTASPKNSGKKNAINTASSSKSGEDEVCLEVDSRDIVTRCSFERVVRIVSCLTNEQKAMVVAAGFGSYLNVDFPHVYSPLVQWLVQGVDVGSNCLNLYG